jgi:CubicO group peptidase (beta-lactamase class C family)
MKPTPEQLHEVDRFMQGELKRLRIPGAYAVVAGGEVLLTGFHDPEARGAITADTPFEIGSITKSLTATAILQLRDQGLVDLDAPVQRYLPWFRLADGEASARITIRHLLTHASGIARGVEGRVVVQDYDRIYASVEAGARGLHTVKPASAPGTKFAYSNMGYATLGAVVEAVAGRRWAEYIQAEIMAPLGMTRSMADYTAGPLPIATPHRWAAGRPVPVGHRVLGPFLAPAGSTTACSVKDLARYLAAHMGDIPLPGVTAESLTEAHRGTVSMAGQMSYGFGWVEQTTKNGDKTIWHNGGTEGSTAIAMFDPAAGVGVVVLVSRMTMLTDRLGGRMLAILREKEAKPVKAGFDLLKTMSLAVAAFALLAAVLLVALVQKMISGAPTGWGTVVCSAVPAAVLWVLLPQLPGMVGLPLRKLRYWPADLLAAYGGMLTATTLWAIYSFYRLII